MRAIVAMLTILSAVLQVGCGGRIDGGPPTPRGSCGVSAGCAESVDSGPARIACDAGYPACAADGSFEAGPPPDDGYPPPGCPAPDQAISGGPCAEAGLDCPGDPNLCDGTVFYDALQCEYAAGGALHWVVSAATVCDVDASFDAPFYDAGSPD